MSVYVDDCRNPLRFMLMSHMIADSPAELREMADKIEVRQKWIQHPGEPNEHLDICQWKRRLAIEFGAVPIGRRDLARKIIDRRGTVFAVGDPDRLP